MLSCAYRLYFIVQGRYLISQELFMLKSLKLAAISKLIFINSNLKLKAIDLEHENLNYGAKTKLIYSNVWIICAFITLIYMKVLD